MSVFKRPGSPYYYAEFKIKGHRFCRSTGKRTEREARQEERKLKAECAAKIGDRQRLGDALTIDQGFGKYWLEHGQTLAWSSEVARYIKIILETANPHQLIEDLTDADINDYVQAHIAAGRGQYALNRALSIWRAMHRRARKKWRQRTQEIDWSDFMNPEQKRVRHISVTEARRLTDWLPEHVGRAVEWSLYTGTRKFETFGLLWEDVDVEKGRATVLAKGGRRHTVWLSPQALDLLARCPRSGRYVFDKRGVRYAFEKGVIKAGLDGLRWHDLRHTAATWMRQAGHPLEVVQRFLGHADVATTTRYAHVDDREVQKAVRDLPRIGTNTPSKVVAIPLKRHSN